VHNELGIQADNAFHSGAGEEGAIGVALVNIAKASQQRVRNKLHVPAGGDALEANRSGSLIESSLNADRDTGPEQVFIGARDAAVQNDSPFLCVGSGKAQALEGNGHEHHVTPLGKASLRMPDGIERRIKPAVVAGKSILNRTFGP